MTQMPNPRSWLGVMTTSLPRPADSWLVTGEDSGIEPLTPQHLAVREWSLSQLSDDDRSFISYAGSLLCGSHTHLQQVRRIGSLLFFNPGSIGLAYDHRQDESAFRADPWAKYAVLSVDIDTLALEFRRVPLDVEQLVEIILASGRPYAEEMVAQYG